MIKGILLAAALSLLLCTIILAPALGGPTLPSPSHPVLSELARMTVLPPQQIAGPSQIVSSQVPAQQQLLALDRVKELYTRIQQPSFAAFQAQYGAIYEIAAQMQAESDSADRAFMRGYSPPISEFLIEQNVKIHALLAIMAARVGYEELYEKHMDVILERIRRHNGYLGQTAEAALMDILQTDQTNAGVLLSQEYCQWAAADLCIGVQPTFFQSYRAAAGNPVEFTFDRSPNLYQLGDFAISVVDPSQASPYSLMFSSVFNHMLERPLVSNWFLRYYLNQPVQPMGLVSPQPGQPQVFAQQSRISVEPGDYFVIDPADLQKQAWRNTIAAMFRQEQTVTLSLRIPDGEYYVHRRSEPIAPGTRPNLVVDRLAGTAPRGFELIMHPSGTSVRVVPIGPAVTDEGFLVRLFKPDFKLLRFDVGANSETNIEGGGQFRLFHRFSRNVAWQTQFEGAFRSHHDTLDLLELPRFIDRENREFDDFQSLEFQLDLGPVFRFGNIQLAAMESLRWVDRDGWDSVGYIGHFFFNVGYLFSRGQVGGFATIANKDESVVRTVQFDQILWEETYLKVVDQIGINFNLALTRNSSVEGAFGLLDTANRGDTPGGVVRFFFPPWKRLVLTAEFGYNESFVAPDDSWRFGFGLRIGQWGRSSSPSTYVGDRDEGPVPVFVPRVRYETLTRVVRRGNRPPIADAGPDMEDLVPMRLSDGRLGRRVQLDGTNSSDPDGDTITLKWTKGEDCAREIELQDDDTPNPSFVIGNGEKCTVILVVTDALGLDDEDKVVVSTLRVDAPVIRSFTARPAEIRQGASSTLKWEVIHADTITITDVPGPLDPEGEFVVTPEDTTTYVLTACNAINECVSAEATVTVLPEAPPEIVSFVADPPEGRIGNDPACDVATEAGTTLSWETENADIVTLDGERQVDADGQLHVCLTQTTTFTLVASNNEGENVSADLTVRVSQPFPEIISFTADPAEIRAGDTSKLSWKVTQADTITITGVPGRLDPEGEIHVKPEDTTTYTLTACNALQECVTAEATVTVRPEAPPEIVSFVADPPEARIGDDPACAPTRAGTRLTWDTENADIVTLDGFGEVAKDNPTGVHMCLSQTTTFTLIASNNEGENVSADLTVRVFPPFPEIISFTANPAEIRAGDSSTLSWEVVNADTITITNFPGTQPATGTAPVEPVDTTTYTLTACNALQECVTAEATVTVRPKAPPEIVSFVADPPETRIGDDPACAPTRAGTRLTWDTENADIVTLDGFGEVAKDNPTGLHVCLSQTTTFTLIASNNEGENVSADLTVRVFPPFPEIISFTANPAEIRAGGSSTLSWKVVNADTITITDVPGLLGSEGEFVVTPEDTTTYTLTACNALEECVTAEATVTVFPKSALEIVSFEANPALVPQSFKGEAVQTTLSWRTRGCDYAELAIRPEMGNRAVSDVACDNPNFPVEILNTTEFTLTIFDKFGESVQATITVEAVQLPQPMFLSCTATPPEVQKGQYSRLCWTTKDADKVELIRPGYLPTLFPPNHCVDVTPAGTTTYLLNALDQLGVVGDQCSLRVVVKP